MTEVFKDIQRVATFARQAISGRTWCHVLADAGHADVGVVVSNLGPVTRRVRGDKMRSINRLHDEFAAAWQFGDYDGPSYGAFFRDSLLDLFLTWPTTTGFVIVITEAEQILLDEPGEHDRYSPLRGLIATFANAADNYAEPERGEPSDSLARPALSFDVVLVTDAEHRDEVVRRWRAAGAPIGD